MGKNKGEKTKKVSRSPINNGREPRRLCRLSSALFFGFGFFIPTHPARQRGAYIGIKLGYINLPNVFVF